MTAALTLMDTARAHALAVLASLDTPKAAPTPAKFGKKAEREARVLALWAQWVPVLQIVRQTGASRAMVYRLKL